MERLRSTIDADPASALDLALEGERHYPNGSYADERAFLKMRTLVHLQQIAPARVEAEAFFERYPESAWRRQVSRLTGVHPRPAPRSSR